MFLFNFVRNFFSSRNERILKEYEKIVSTINFFENNLSYLKINELSYKTTLFKQRLSNGEKVEKILPEAFAVVREVSKRVIKMRHFDVQLLGGLCLFYGKIAEMQTGEGKTVVATLPAYLNYLLDCKVHIVTVNDYLAQRDALWMRPIFEVLGVDVGILTNNVQQNLRAKVYTSGIVYGTNNEFVFDYLRDNMVFNVESIIQKKLSFAIIDEVDSILIDEARTPLIISSSKGDSFNIYRKINNIVYKFIRKTKFLTHYLIVDEKSKQVYLNDNGYKEFEYLLEKNKLLENDKSLYSSLNLWLIYHIQISLKAHLLVHKNVDYVLNNNSVEIIDEHTGRVLEGRRWSGGLHQAVEAKENVYIQNESKILASITFQNYFRLYEKLSGMTGTAVNEAYEFQYVYNLEVVVVPTHKKCVRKDYPDVVFLTREEKYNNVLNDVKNCVVKKQPVLIGTINIEISEILSNLFKENRIKHNVLNAKYHEKEALIISEAGKPGAVTIATNMAGRGTDIILGGADITEDFWYEDSTLVKSVGGLHVIGTERHESRRIDNQLRGRSGRQGDPGSSLFYLSLEDNLLRIFVSSRLASFFKKLWVEKNVPIKHKLIDKGILNAQNKVEGHHSEIRKQLLDFDDILNEQRSVFFKKRLDIVRKEDVSDISLNFVESVLRTLYTDFFKDCFLFDSVIYNEFCNLLKEKYFITIILNDEDKLTMEKMFASIYEKIVIMYNERRKKLGVNNFCLIEKKILLTIFDYNWQQHLTNVESLKESIGLRSYAQKDPKQEYKKEVFSLFFSMLLQIKEEFFIFLFRLDEKK